LDTSSRIFVAGHRGLVGSAVVRALHHAGFPQVLTVGREQVDLEDKLAVQAFFDAERPTHVVLAAAKVGGIGANVALPADFIRSNLAIQCNVIETAYQTGVQKLLFLGSSCMYPRAAAQPIREEALLTGPLEPTNAAYAIAKIAGVVMCQSYYMQHGARFISAIPTNLYGPGDNFDPAQAHVLPALLRRFHEAALRGDDELVVWGTGTPRREFLHVDDMAAACVLLLREYESPQPINVGSGSEVTIAELATLLARVTGFTGRIVFDPSRPDGMPRKLMDSSRLRALGWVPEIALEDGVRDVLSWYVKQRSHLAARA